MQPQTPQAHRTNKDNTPPAQTRVALVGDSITELTRYPDYLSQMLGKNYLVGNFGACGSTVFLDSYSAYMHGEAFNEAKNFKPDIIVVMLGTNDANPSIKENSAIFIEDYIVLLEKFQALEGKPRVWVVKPPPIFDDTFGFSKKGLAGGVIPAIEEVARRVDVPIIDVYSALSDSHCFLDSVHPNDEGAKIIAHVVYQALILP